MHYKNGKEAHNGDKVIWLNTYGPPVIGILYDAVAGNDACNGRLACLGPSNPTPNLAECLLLDDVLGLVPPSTPAAPAAPVPPVVNTQGEPAASPTTPPPNAA